MLSCQKIEDILRGQLRIQKIQVVDNSHLHGGHNPQAALGGTHFDLHIVSEDFEGLSLIERHQKVYSVLGGYFEAGLHALSMKTQTPSEG